MLKYFESPRTQWQQKINIYLLGGHYTQTLNVNDSSNFHLIARTMIELGVQI